MSIDQNRSVRVFLSSTFRDFGEERDILVRKVFPQLRSRLKHRLVELVDVDLRWGITAEQAERGEVLPICLVEIDRARPFFVGMLGERYGWIPTADRYAPNLLEQQPWLEGHRGGRSVTELEILHGVLNNPDMIGRAFFYFRSTSYSREKGGDYVASSSEDAARQTDLKDRIRSSGVPVMEDYPSPEAFAARLEQDLWAVLDEAFPADQVPDAFAQASQRHEAYAAPRRRLYLGGERYVARLNALFSGNAKRVLIEGQSGGGKSALLANWLAAHRAAHPRDLFYSHFTGASPDAADVYAMVHRLCEAIRRQTGSSEEIVSDPQKLIDNLPDWLALAASHAERQDTRWFIVIDALNGLTDLRDLRWWPEFLPERVHVLVSCLPGDVLDAIQSKGNWDRVTVEPLDGEECRILLRAYLSRYNKTLPLKLEAMVLSHPLASNPLFLRTLAEELRLFGVHEQLAERLSELLTSRTVDDLFEKVLERVELDCGVAEVRAAMEGLWASRSGLTELEILGLVGLVPATWAPIRIAMDDALLESGGRITFAHDYLRIAVSDRYLCGDGTLNFASQSSETRMLWQAVHARLAEWFEAHAADTADEAEVDARVAEEVPYQWHMARNWSRLKACLTARPMFEAMRGVRPEEELLWYWLELKREVNIDLAEAYEASWTVWAVDETRESSGALASDLSRFLAYAGQLNSVTKHLAEFALSLAVRRHGPEHPVTGTSLNNLAILLKDMGDYAAAEPLYRRALAIAEKAQGPEHPETGKSLNNLAVLLKVTGDYAAAESLYRRALTIAEKAQGLEHPVTGTSLNNLAVLLQNMGDYAAAEPLFRRALAIAERAQGPEHPETWRSLNNLAVLLKDMGDYAAAEPLYRRALAIAEKAQGPEHPATGTSLRNLAVLLKDMGDYAAAEPLCRRALAIAEKAQGPEHPVTGTSLNNLASLLQNMGDYGSAEPLFRRALVIAEKAQGPEHPETKARLNNLALLLADMGDYGSAEPLHRRALAIAEKAQGPEHPSTGTSLSNLASLLKDMGDYTAAKPLYRRALAIAEKAQGPEHPSTGTSLNNLAGLLQDMGDHAAAEPLFRRALAIAEKAQGPEHPKTGTRLNNLALLLANIGDYGSAEPLYRRALAIAEKAQGAEHPTTGMSLNNLASLLQDMGDHAAAEPLYRRALAIAEKAQGPEHPSTGTSLSNLASLLQDMGDYTAAEPLYRRALAIAEKAQGPEHPETGMSLNNLASLLKDIGDCAAAEPLYGRALVIAEKAQGPEHPSTGTSLSNLASLLQDMGDYGAAEPLYRRALVIAEKALGPEHPQTGASLNNLAGLLEGMGDYAAAEPLYRRALAIAEKAEGHLKDDLLRSIQNLGVFLRNAGKLDAAEIELSRALTLAAEKHGPRSEESASALSAIGRLHQLQERLDDAKEALERSLDIRLELYRVDDDRCIATSQRLAEVLSAMGNC